MDILYLITDNDDLCNILGNHICKQRQYKMNFNKCLIEITHINYKSFYLRNIKKTNTMLVMRCRNNTHYLNICNNILNFNEKDIITPVIECIYVTDYLNKTFNYYINPWRSIDRGRIDSIINTTGKLQAFYKTPNTLPLLYIRLQRDLNRNQFTNKKNYLTNQMYKSLIKSRAFKL